MKRLGILILLTMVTPHLAFAGPGRPPPGWRPSNTKPPVNPAAPAAPAGPNAGILRLMKAKDSVAKLRTSLSGSIFGQDYALDQIAAQYGETQKNRTGKPKVLVAMGPSGGGKTFTAVELSKLLHGGKYLEISGNEFRSHAGSLENFKLFGSRSGAGSKGSLIQAAEDNPDGFTFVINEGEKMNPDIWLMLMEFLDKGVISDPNGKALTVKNLWVVITSNRGNKRMFPPTSKNWSQAEVDQHVRGFTQQELQGYFMQKDGLADSFQLPDEIIKRIDQFVAFGPTTKEAALLMARKTVDDLSASYLKEYSITLKFDDAALEDVAVTAWKSSNDARTINRAVRSLMSEVLDTSVEKLKLMGGETINVSLITDSRGQKHYHAEANNNSFQIAAGVNTSQSPLANAELRERLSGMQREMSKIVLGQDETIKAISDAIISHYGRGIPTRPFSAYLLGPSGNGKTETGRALAKVLYGTDKRSAIIPMGNVGNEDDFGNVFGSAAKFQGGDVERQFEKTLRENPNGAVIVLDEVSNMGGGDKNRKTALFQKLYDILEEGRWTSPIDGREYDLSKYQFILTGNDGEQFFRGITADDLLLSTWKEEKKLDKVREMMRDSGIPNAFINRLNVVALTKPLLRSEVGGVTQKLWDRQVMEFLKTNPGIEIVAGPNLVAQLSQTFFTADQGGRSVRKILEDKIGALLTYALLHTNADFTNLHGYKVVVDLADSSRNRAYDLTSTKPRQVLFRAAVYKDDQLIDTEQLDVTEVSPSRVAMNSRDARVTAYHEAGHAAANLEELSQEGVQFITIRGGSDGKIKYLGYARYSPLLETGVVSLNHDQVVARLARLWAGSKAQQMAGFKTDSGWSQDLKMMRTLANQALMIWGLEPSLAAVSIDENGKPSLNGEQFKVYNDRLQSLFNEGEILAEKLLTQRWPLVRAITAELLLRGQIDRTKYLSLKQRYQTSDPQTLQPRQQPRESAMSYGRCEMIFM